jgi:hypothetical protein
MPGDRQFGVSLALEANTLFIKHGAHEEKSPHGGKAPRFHTHWLPPLPRLHRRGGTPLQPTIDAHRTANVFQWVSTNAGVSPQHLPLWQEQMHHVNFGHPRSSSPGHCCPLSHQCKRISGPPLRLGSFHSPVKAPARKLTKISWESMISMA